MADIFKKIYFSILLFLGLGTLVLLAFRVWVPVVLLIASIAVTALLILLRKRPEILLTIGIAISFMPEGKNLGYPLFILLFLYLIIRRMIIEKSIFKLDFISKIWLIIIMLGLITISKWHYYFMGIQWFMSLAIIPFIFYVLLNNEYIDQGGATWLLSYGFPIIIGVVIIESFAAIGIFLFNNVNEGISVKNLLDARHVSIPDVGSNRLAGVLVFCASFGLFTEKFWHGNWLKNNLILGSLYVAIILSFLLISRGALISLAIAISIFLMGKLLLGKKIAIKKIKILPIFVISIIIFMIMQPFIKDLVYRMQHIKYSVSTLSRLSLWNNCILKIKDSPFIGTGPAQYEYRVFSENLEDPHNIFLRYGVEFGILGLISIFIIFIYPFVLFIKKYSKNRERINPLFLSFAPSLLGVLVHSQIDSLIGSRTAGPLIWLVWALFIKLLNGYKVNF